MTSVASVGSVASRFTPRLRGFKASASVVLAVLIAGCEREERRFTELPPTANPAAATPTTSLQPGPTRTVFVAEAPYDDKAWAASEGKRLFALMNCSGCHANGGGGMGPPLMDDQWIYGSAGAQIFLSIAEGRPNGMPAWKDRLTTQQIWQLVAYVRSLSGLTPRGARPGRDDHLYGKPAEQQTPNAAPRAATPPPPYVP